MEGNGFTERGGFAIESPVVCLSIIQHCYTVLPPMAMHYIIRFTFHSVQQYYFYRSGLYIQWINSSCVR